MRPAISILVLLIGSCTVLCAAQSAQVPQPASFLNERSSTPLPPDSAVVTGTLENGLRYYIRANKKPEKRAELRLVVNSGSTFEQNDQRGLAHFLEHLAFNGSQNFPKQEVVKFLESVGMTFGAHTNAYTSFDETVYQMQIPTDSLSVIEKGIRILEDWAHNLSLEPAAIDKERSIIIEEWRLRDQGVSGRLMNRFFPIFFDGSVYAERMPIGVKAVLDTFKHERLRQFYRDWYRPERMAVVVVGDCDVPTVERLIRQYLSQIPKSVNAPPVPPLRLFPTPNREPVFVNFLDKENSYPFVQVTWKHPPQRLLTAQDYRRTMLTSILYSMLNSRLYEIVAKNAKPPFSDASVSQSSYTRNILAPYLFVGTKDDGLLAGLEAAYTEVCRVKQHGFTQAEFDRIKAGTLKGIEQAYAERTKTQSAGYVGNYVAHFLGQESMHSAETDYALRKELLASLRLEDFVGVATEVFTDSNQVVVVALPQKNNIPVPSREELLRVLAAVQSSRLEPYRETVLDGSLLPSLPAPARILREHTNARLGTTEWQLSNGARVVLKPTDFQNDQVLMQSFASGGYSLASKDEWFDAANSAGMESPTVSGIGAFTGVDVQKKLSGKSVSVSPYMGELFHGINGNCSVADIETMLQLTYAAHTQPRRDTTLFRSVQTRNIDGLANRSVDPQAAFSDTINTTLSNYHYTSKPPSKELFERWDHLGRGFEYYRKHFGNARGATFVLVGSFKPDSIKSFVERYIGGLPSKLLPEKWRDMGVTRPRGVITKEVRKGVDSKSTVYLSFSGAFEWNYRNVLILSVLSDVADTKLRELLRNDAGGVYASSVGASDSYAPKQEYNISISFPCAPERVGELTKTTMLLVDSLRAGMFGDQFLRDAKEKLLKARETGIKTNDFWLERLSFWLQKGESPETVLQFKNIVNAVTADDIKHMAHHCFDTKNYVKVVLYPESKKE